MKASANYFVKVALIVYCLHLTSIGQISAAKILCVSHQFGSHMLMVHTAVEDLFDRGHDIYTVFSDKMPAPKGLQEKGFKIIRYHTPEWSDIFGSDALKEDILRTALATPSGVVNHEGDSIRSCNECKDMDNDTAFLETLESHNFDLVVTDTFMLCNCLYFIPLKLGIPFIPVSPWVVAEINRLPALPSFYPLTFHEFGDKMTFWQRLRNTVDSIMVSIPEVAPFPGIRDTTLLEKYNKDPNVKSWTQLGRKASLFLIPRGPVLEYIVPLMPHTINIECLTCKPGKELPENIANMVNKHHSKFIVISFGSVVDTLPDEITEQFLTALETRTELVFWRYGGTLPRKTNTNIHVMKWLPQNDLLAHPKAALFITHSGNNGQYESVYHGVPMLAFPLFAEQHHNAYRIVDKGLGLRSDIHTVTSSELTQKISELIDNPKYQENTRKASKILRARPMNARQTAAFWINHVLEFGSDHLRSHILDMDWYSLYMLDIIIFLQITVIIFLITMYISVKFICRKIFGSKIRKEKEN